MSKALAITESRELAVVANHELTQAVTDFGGYTDPSGVSATSPAGLMKSFNSAVKREFGLPVVEMSEDMQLHVASLRLRVSKIIHGGMSSGMLRADIKKMIRDSVKVSAQAYLMMTEPGHERH